MDQDHWLAQLYLQHKREFLCLAWTFVKHHQQAEEIVHGMVLRLARLAKPPNDPRLYALRTLRNLAIDAVRKRKVVREEPFTESTRAETLAGDSVFEDPRLRPDCDDEVSQQRLKELEHAMQQLDLDSREVVRYHLQLGLTFREISELTEHPLQTTASRYRRAIEKLKTILGVQHAKRSK